LIDNYEKKSVTVKQVMLHKLFTVSSLI